MRWILKNIVLCSFFIAIWSLLSTSLSIFRPFFFTTGFIPVFYFLIWFQAFYFPPREAFITGFLGHALFDVSMIFDFFFIFIWFASGISCFFISLLKKRKKLIFLMVILMPIIYIIFFLIMGELKFFSEKSELSFIDYLKANPTIVFMITIVNPIFNLFVYLFFVKNRIVKKILEIFEYKEYKIRKLNE